MTPHIPASAPQASIAASPASRHPSENLRAPASSVPTQTHKARHPSRSLAPWLLPSRAGNTVPLPLVPDTPPHSPPQSESTHSHLPPSPRAAAKTPPATLDRTHPGGD